ncbi:hypothetical protein DIPPA_22399 [Diplonema papillatum]|nr:hypothetical protein DIPPA_22399 [Diplonema papillatum]
MTKGTSLEHAGLPSIAGSVVGWGACPRRGLRCCESEWSGGSFSEGSDDSSTNEIDTIRLPTPPKGGKKTQAARGRKGSEKRRGGARSNNRSPARTLHRSTKRANRLKQTMHLAMTQGPCASADDVVKIGEGAGLCTSPPETEVLARDLQQLKESLRYFAILHGSDPRNPPTELLACPPAACDRFSYLRSYHQQSPKRAPMLPIMVRSETPIAVVVRRKIEKLKKLSLEELEEHQQEWLQAIESQLKPRHRQRGGHNFIYDNITNACAVPSGKGLFTKRSAHARSKREKVFEQFRRLVLSKREEHVASRMQRERKKFDAARLRERFSTWHKVVLFHSSVQRWQLSYQMVEAERNRQLNRSVRPNVLPKMEISVHLSTAARILSRVVAPAGHALGAVQLKARLLLFKQLTAKSEHVLRTQVLKVRDKLRQRKVDLILAYLRDHSGASQYRRAVMLYRSTVITLQRTARRFLMQLRNRMELWTMAFRELEHIVLQLQQRAESPLKTFGELIEVVNKAASTAAVVALPDTKRKTSVAQMTGTSSLSTLRKKVKQVLLSNRGLAMPIVLKGRKVGEALRVEHRRALRIYVSKMENYSISRASWECTGHQGQPPAQPRFPLVLALPNLFQVYQRLLSHGNGAVGKEVRPFLTRAELLSYSAVRASLIIVSFATISEQPAHSPQPPLVDLAMPSEQRPMTPPAAI